MRPYFDALWLGLTAGTTARTRAEAPVPARISAAGSLCEAVYWFGFEVSNALVHGRKP